MSRWLLRTNMNWNKRENGVAPCPPDDGTTCLTALDAWLVLNCNVNALVQKEVAFLLSSVQHARELKCCNILVLHVAVTYDANAGKAWAPRKQYFITEPKILGTKCERLIMLTLRFQRCWLSENASFYNLMSDLSTYDYLPLNSVV